eukprot:TRINITY_DN7659_c0_g1_i3.p2 TRINITY_DN7659_c0_g1~~TRINITY_DN7659_c0_g1_i3.p2  ORF type:complete len:317 (+),score=150.93 TRINITY_DN7659_c0_g1_i3:45-995(+)
MGIDEEKLSTKTRQTLKRFVDQETQSRALQGQLAMLQKRRDVLEAEKDMMLKERAKHAGMKESLSKLSVDLRKKKDETIVDIKQREQQEAEVRQALTQKFQNTITDITVRMETDADEQMQAVNENKRLRQRLQALGQQVDLKAQQYEQLLKTREFELRLSEAKSEHLKEMAKGDRLRTDLQQKQLEAERTREAVLKEQLSQLTTKFDELQVNLTKSNKLFKEYKAEMDKMTKRKKQLENEKAEILRKHTNKRRTFDPLSVDVAEQRKKLEQLQKTEKAMTGVAEIMKQEERDFEAWRAACPEAYAAARAAVEAEKP